MSTLKDYTKGPAPAELDYIIDWNDWLLPGETITSAVWSADQPGLTFRDDQIIGGSCVVWIGAGTVGLNYTVSVTITTSASLNKKDVRSIGIRIRPR